MREEADTVGQHDRSGYRLRSNGDETTPHRKMFASTIERAAQLLAFGAIASVVLFAFKALWVARMDVHVAVALVTNTPLTTAFQVIAVTLIPSLCYLGSSVLYYIYAPRLRTAVRAAWSGEERPVLAGAENLLTKTFIPITALGTATLLLWALTVGVKGFSWQSMAINFMLSICPILAIFFLRFFRSSRRSISQTLPKILLVYIALHAVSSLGSAVTSPSMWLPPEQVKTTKGNFVMYILGAENERVIAFIPSNRAVVQIPADEVIERQFCSPYFRANLAATLWGSPVMPSCFYESDDFYPVDLSYPNPGPERSGPPDQLP
ncbi:hypothetical protein ACFQ36_02875 [Arthrobacter sp. GCM10027362]|uniref:hypothetical protein n=1 Tax=Arthrobacter sp. GCM10027362 TaxID=3273379 RepID=UPI003635753D